MVWCKDIDLLKKYLTCMQGNTFRFCSPLPQPHTRAVCVCIYEEFVLSKKAWQIYSMENISERLSWKGQHENVLFFHLVVKNRNYLESFEERSVFLHFLMHPLTKHWSTGTLIILHSMLKTCIVFSTKRHLKLSFHLLNLKLDAFENKVKIRISCWLSVLFYLWPHWHDNRATEPLLGLALCHWQWFRYLFKNSLFYPNFSGLIHLFHLNYASTHIYLAGKFYIDHTKLKAVHSLSQSMNHTG